MIWESMTYDEVCGKKGGTRSKEDTLWWHIKKERHTHGDVPQ